MTRNSGQILYAATTMAPWQETGEQQKLPSWLADNATGQD